MSRQKAGLPLEALSPGHLLWQDSKSAQHPTDLQPQQHQCPLGAGPRLPPPAAGRWDAANICRTCTQLGCPLRCRNTAGCTSCPRGAATGAGPACSSARGVQRTLPEGQLHVPSWLSIHALWVTSQVRLSLTSSWPPPARCTPPAAGSVLLNTGPPLNMKNIQWWGYCSASAAQVYRLPKLPKVCLSVRKASANGRVLWQGSREA